MASTFCAGQGGQFDQIKYTWVVHLWLVNDNVFPPVYLLLPAVVDTRCEEQLLLPLQDAQKLHLAEDTLLAGRGIVDAAHNITPVLTYKPVWVLVPMLNELDGQLAFYMPGWLNCKFWQGCFAGEGSFVLSSSSRSTCQRSRSAGHCYGG